MYEIVAGVDTSEERARAEAEAITEMPLDVEQVHVTLVHNFRDNPEGASVTDVAAVRRARELLEDADIDVTLQETSGDPARGILSMADEVEADLVVVAGRKQTPTGKVLFGSVTQAVVLGTDRPVLVCSGEQE